MFISVYDDNATIQSKVAACFGTASAPHGLNSASNDELVFGPGRFHLTQPIVLPQVVGAKIRGQGRFATYIDSTGPVFVTDGFAYSDVRDMTIQPAGGSVGFDLDWKGQAGGNCVQGNTFANLFIEGGAYGFRVGASGYQASENIWHNCQFANQTEAGLSIENYNALQNTVQGGNIAGCKVGVLVKAGSVCVRDVGFQRSTSVDIGVYNSANDVIVISGCRSESNNFAQLLNWVTAVVSGCSHNGSGYLVDSGACLAVQGCTTRNGYVHVKTGTQATISASQFGIANWLRCDPTATATVTDVRYGAVQGDGVLVRAQTV